MNLGLALHYAAERRPGAEALVDDHVRLSYLELEERVARLAGGLASLGIDRNDVVATILKNRHETVELFWACQWLGARFVPLSWRNAPADVGYCVTDAGAKAVVFEEASTEHTEAVSHDVSITVAAADGVGSLTFDDLLTAEPRPGTFDLPDDAISIMLYTSGTTGRPKGVPRSHNVEKAAGLSQALQHGYGFGDRTLGIMPLYHTMGIHSMLAMSLVSGCYVCIPDWDAGEAIELIERERISSLYLAPTLFHDLVHHPAMGSRDISSVRALGYAGAVMTGTLVNRCVEAFDPEVFVNHYGSTEIYTYSIDRNQRRKAGSAGRPSVNAWLRLVRPEDGAGPEDLVTAGEDGHIICHMSSDEAFSGYWNRPDADAKAIREGWYFTGDLGRVDTEGDLWIVGRIDDMIISGGENIHPLEVEEVLAGAPGVNETAVIGVSDDRWGQRVVAFVVATEDVTAEELDAFCLQSETLARFKRPREYRMVDALPKSPSGKILRRMLRDKGATT